MYKSIVTNIIMFLSVILTLILTFVNTDDSKILLPLFPLIYSVIFIGLAKIHYFYQNPGMFVVNIIVLLRYLIMPTLIIFSPNYSDSYGNLNKGIELMIYESIIIGFFLIYITKKFYSNKNTDYSIKFYQKNNNTIFKIISILGILIVFVNPEVLRQYNYVFSSVDSMEFVKGRWLITGIGGIVLDWGKLILPLLLSICFIKKYRIKEKKIYFYLTIFVILIFNVLIFSGTSRNSVIMPAIGSLFFLIRVFPEKKKGIFLFFSLIILLVILHLTLVKTSYIGVNSFNSMDDITNYLEAYFLGPKNYGISQISKEVYGNSFSLQTFLNDIFGNFPGFSDFFELENRTNTFYNIIYHNGGLARDAIIPSIGQGLFYFGTIFSVLPQLLSLQVMAYLDKQFWKSNSLVSIYFISYFAVRFGFTYIQNISIILSFIYSMIIPISIFIYLSNKFKIRR